MKTSTTIALLSTALLLTSACATTSEPSTSQQTMPQETASSERGIILISEIDVEEEPMEMKYSSTPDVVKISSGTVANVYFKFNKDTMSARQKQSLDNAVVWLQSNPKKGLVAVGHADPIGDRKYNMFLAKNRAEAVVNYIVDQGINPKRLRAVTHGEAEARVEEPSKEDKASYRPMRRVVLQTDPANAYGVNSDSISADDWY